jgi:hypothetical protein
MLLIPDPLIRSGGLGLADLLHTDDRAAREIAALLPLTRDIHDDHVAVPGCFWRDAHVGRAPIRIMDGEHDLRVRPSLETARWPSHAHSF